MSLKPEYVEFLKNQRENPAPAVWEIPIAQTRAFSQEQMKIAAPITPLHSIEDKYIPGVTADLHVRIFRPSSEPNLPAIVYFHGSGWAVGFIDLFNPALAYLAKESNAIVIAVNYQKAPENPFPTPFDDCYATLQWVVANAHGLGIDPTKIGVAGDSAGGNLAAATALKARDEKLVKLAFQMLVYPCINFDFSTDSYKEFAQGYGLTTKAMEWFWNQYLQDLRNAENPYACPSRAQTFKDLPPAVIISAQYDPLVSDSYLYRDLLAADGIPVVYKEFEGVIHGFFRAPEITPSSYEAISFVAVEIKKLTV